VRPIAVLFVVLWAAGVGAQTSDQRGDEIIVRTKIEARGRNHGEFRLVRRDESVVVQTLLVTRSLKRAAARIRDKEEANWPKDSPGYGASLRYVEAVAAAVAEILETEKSGDRKRRLLIEIELSENAGGISLWKPSTRSGEGGLTLVTGELIARLELPCSWTRREMVLVAEDRGLDLQKLVPLPDCALH